MRIPSRKVHSTNLIALLPSRGVDRRCTNSIVSIPLCECHSVDCLCGSHCVDSFGWIPLRGLPCVDSLVRIPSFYRGDFIILSRGSIVEIPSFYRGNSIVGIPSFYRADSIVRIPSFYRGNSIVGFPSFYRADSIV